MKILNLNIIVVEGEKQKNLSSNTQKIFSADSGKKFLNLKKIIHKKVQEACIKQRNWTGKEFHMTPNHLNTKYPEKRKNIKSYKGKIE